MGGKIFISQKSSLWLNFISGFRNRQNGTISGSRNRPKMTISGARNHHYGSILFLAPEIVKMGQFLAPEIVNLIKRSYIEILRGSFFWEKSCKEGQQVGFYWCLTQSQIFSEYNMKIQIAKFFQPLQFLCYIH